MQKLNQLKYNLKALINNPQITGLLITGTGGLGKTYTTMSYLEGKPTKYYNGSITPLQLYKLLYFNQENIIILDDVDEILTNKKILALLKGALWDTKGERIVTYETTSPYSADVPSQFIFQGQIIIITNDEITTNRHLQALKSRLLHVELTYTYEETRDLMESFMLESKEFSSYTKETRELIWNELKDSITPYAKELNFRQIKQAFQYYDSLQSNNIWKGMLRELIPQDETYKIVQDIITNKTYKTVKEQIIAFNNSTGLNRASFFIYKNKIGATRKYRRGK